MLDTYIASTKHRNWTLRVFQNVQGSRNTSIEHRECHIDGMDDKWIALTNFLGDFLSLQHRPLSNAPGYLAEVFVNRHSIRYEENRTNIVGYHFPQKRL